MHKDLYRFDPMSYLTQSAGESVTWGDIFFEAQAMLDAEGRASLDHLDDIEDLARQALRHLNHDQLRKVADNLGIGF